MSGTRARGTGERDPGSFAAAPSDTAAARTAIGSRGLDVGALLERVEGIAPIEAVQAAAEALAEMLDARELTFLIADFSGRAVVLLTSAAAGAEGARLQAG